MSCEVDSLKTAYAFPGEGRVEQFLGSHPAMSAVLLDAVPRLRGCFGTDVSFKLDICDGVLYAVAIWRGLTPPAELALEQFEEIWGLAAAPPGLWFTYEIAEPVDVPKVCSSETGTNRN